jgi:2,4-dienoyl-CoA reductase-like NADH-dependent reductase (Old Yellow Enzyme family)
MGDYSALLQPLTIKGITFRNRVMSGGHVPGYASGGKPGERYQLYHEEKAKGGIGLTIFGGVTSVSFESPPLEFNQLSLADDSVIPDLRAFAERVHRHGAKLMIQMYHAGRKVQHDVGPWLAPMSPSKSREPLHRGYPKEIEPHDMRRIVKAFGQAARRCKEGGLDGCELQGAYHGIVDSFWSPIANQRTDEYGGSLENRARYGLEVLEEIRRQAGDDFVVGLRISADEMIDGGNTPEECRELAKFYAATGLIDFLDVVGGSGYDDKSIAGSMPGMEAPNATYLSLASRIKAETDIPIFHGTRITDLATAARAIENGHCDMVAMTRAHIADPHIMRKLKEDRVEEIRPCVGANMCVSRAYRLGEALCAHNVATGRESFIPQIVSRAATKRRVVVVGAGPGGLEAARVSAERGHDVVLFEADRVPGGQINVIARAPWHASLADIVDWLEREVRRLDVHYRLHTEATARMVMEEEPDYVVIATGGTPNPGDFEGAGLVVSTWDILTGTVAPEGGVLLYDDDGRQAGSSCAEFLATRDVPLEIVTPDRVIGADLGRPEYPIHLRTLYARGVTMTPDMRLRRVYREGNKLVAVLRNEYSGGEEERRVDQIVAEHGTLPRDGLYLDLVPHSRNHGEVDLQAMARGEPCTVESNNPGGAFTLFRVGDAVASRTIHAAMFDAMRLCKAI